MGAFGDDIEAFLPVVDGFSGTFRADNEVGVGVLAEHVDHLFHEVVLVAAVDRDAAHLLQYPSEDGLEELIFHHHLELDVVAPEVGKADKEVLNCGVGRHDADGVTQIGRSVVDGFPPAELKSQFPYSFLDTHNQMTFQLSICRVALEKLTPILYSLRESCSNGFTYCFSSI